MHTGRYILVRATWDDEAEVWVAESPDLPGLVTEAPDINALAEKLPGLVQDLLESEDDGTDEIEIPIEVVASFSQRVKVRAHAE
jgi:predicted RNase H-like HicB family nuclease